MVIESCRQLQRGMGKMGQFLFVPEHSCLSLSGFRSRAASYFVFMGLMWRSYMR